MKVLLIDSTSLDQAPYLDTYRKIFEENGAKVEYFTWDKDADAPLSYENNIYCGSVVK